LYDELKKEIKLKKKLHKLKMRMNKLDVISEASIRFEESHVFTSIKPKGNKYLVMLIERAWVSYRNRKKAKLLRRTLKALPYDARVTFLDLEELRGAGSEIDLKKFNI
jgi:hypothetical protein